MSGCSRSVRWLRSLAACSGFALAGASLAGEASSQPSEEPVLVVSPEPGYYMKFARMKPGESGTARVQACVDAKGRITSAALAASSGHAAVDATAVAIVSVSQFRAGLAKGKPKAMCTVLPVNIAGLATKEEFARLPETLPNRKGAMPVYTSAVMLDGTETPEDLAHGGRVLVMICISDAGKVVSTAVIESTAGQSLERSALLTARRFRFTPAKENGKPVGSCSLLPVGFPQRP